MKVLKSTDTAMQSEVGDSCHCGIKPSHHEHESELLNTRKSSDDVLESKF